MAPQLCVHVQMFTTARACSTVVTVTYPSKLQLHFPNAPGSPPTAVHGAHAAHPQSRPG